MQDYWGYEIGGGVWAWDEVQGIGDCFSTDLVFKVDKSQKIGFWWDTSINKRMIGPIQVQPLPDGVILYGTGGMPYVAPQQQAIGGTQSPTYPKLGGQAKGADYYDGIQWLADQVARKPQAQPDPAAKLKPTKAYKCKACSTPLNESDAAVNPKTGNIWGCYKCGGKQLEEVGVRTTTELTEEILTKAAQQIMDQPYLVSSWNIPFSWIPKK